MAIPRQLPLFVSGVALAVAVYVSVSQGERLNAERDVSEPSSPRFDDLEARVASIAARLEQLEKQLAAATAVPGRPSVAASPNSAQDEVRVYDSAARLRLGSDIVVSSPTGVMVSDPAQTTIIGDLKIETPTATLQTTEAVVDAAGGSVHIKANTLSFAPGKSEEGK